MPSLAEKELCTGCSACANICPHYAIDMKSDEEGFLFPIVDVDKCVECKLCMSACPVLSSTQNYNLEKPLSYAMWNRCDRTKSSSGGAFSSFARFVLSRGGVIFGASFDENMECKHIEIQSIDDLKLLRGSKYVQSKIGDSFIRVKEYLKQGRFVLFTGTPCQVDGLNKFLRRDYKNLFTLDLICHGVPSNLVFQSYIHKLKESNPQKYSNITGFQFRRCNGWDKKAYIVLGKKLTPLYNIDKLYIDAFESAAIFRKSCYSCRYSKIPRVGDCTIGDFWGIGRHGTPFNHDVLKGVSLVLINNNKGKFLVENLHDTFCEERTLQEALFENLHLKSPSKSNSERDYIIKAFLNPNISLREINKIYHISNMSIKENMKKYASMLGVFDIVKSIYNYLKVLRS